MNEFSYRPVKSGANPSRVGRALFLILLLASVAACASTPEGKQYQSIATCNLTVQSAARAFGVLYQAHKFEDPILWGDRYDKAKAAYDFYEKVRDAAVDAAKAGGETSIILSSLNAAMNEYLSLLAAFGVK